MADVATNHMVVGILTTVSESKKSNVLRETKPEQPQSLNDSPILNFLGKLHDQFGIDNAPDNPMLLAKIKELQSLAISEIVDKEIMPPKEILVSFYEGLKSLMAGAMSYFSPEILATWQNISKRFAALDAERVKLGAGNDPALPSASPNLVYKKPQLKVELFADNNLGDNWVKTINQGRIADCYFLSVLAGIVGADNGAAYLRNLIKQEGDNYVVNFYKPKTHEPVKITISQDLLVQDNKVWGAGLTDADHDGLPEIGINILEKAFALYSQEYDSSKKGAAGYNALNTGDPSFALEALLGVSTQFKYLKNQYSTDNPSALDSAQVLQLLNAGLEKGPVIAGTSLKEVTDQSHGIYGAHAYTVLGTFSKDGVTYVCLRNPHGTNDPEYVTTAKEDPSAALADGVNDGIFNMTLDSFCQNFSEVFTETVDVNKAPSTQVTSNTLVEMLQHFAGSLPAANMAVDARVLDTIFALKNAETDPNPPPHTDPNSPPHTDPLKSSSKNDFIANKLRTVLALSSGIDVNALVQYILKEVYMENTEELRMYAAKVKFFNDLKKAIRMQMNDAKSVLAANKGKDDGSPLDQGFYVRKEFLNEPNEQGEVQETAPSAAEIAMSKALPKGATEIKVLDPQNNTTPESTKLLEVVKNLKSDVTGVIGEAGAKQCQYIETDKYYVVARPSYYPVTKDKYFDVLIFDKPTTSGKAPTLMTAFWGDPHVYQTSANTNDATYTKSYNGGDYHTDDYKTKTWTFSAGSNFVLPDGTNLFLNTVKSDKDPGTLINGLEVLSGTRRISFTRDTQEVNGTKPVVTEDRLYFEFALRQGGQKNVDTYALSSKTESSHPGEWAKEGADGHYYDVSYNESNNFEPNVAANAVSSVQMQANQDKPISAENMATLKKDKGVCTNYAELEAYIDELDSHLKTVGDDAQMSALELQNMLQKQQQTLQQMSNISKMVFETIMAISRKLS